MEHGTITNEIPAAAAPHLKTQTDNPGGSPGLTEERIHQDVRESLGAVLVPEAVLRVAPYVPPQPERLGEIRYRLADRVSVYCSVLAGSSWYVHLSDGVSSINVKGDPDAADVSRRLIPQLLSNIEAALPALRALAASLKVQP